MNHAPEGLHFGRFAFRSAHHGKSSLMQRISHNYTTSYRPGQHQCGKASFQGEYSESNTHVHAFLPTGRLVKMPVDIQQLLLAVITVQNYFRS